MKKIIFLAIVALFVSINSYAANCLTLGDTIRIHPVHLDGYSQQNVVMYNEGYCDSWTMSVAYPKNLTVKLVSGVTALDGMSIPYYNRYGVEDIYHAPLNVGAGYYTISSEITARGYYDLYGNGEWDSYGTVKWVPGAHAMFQYNFYLDPSFRDGIITFDGRITSGSDQRGPILQDVRFYKSTYIYVGYMLGDVTGNEKWNIDDVTLLISRVLRGEQLDEFAEAAADINQDGQVNIADVTLLIHMVLKKS